MNFLEYAMKLLLGIKKIDCPFGILSSSVKKYYLPVVV